ncbi:hypothetical protein Celaphus_00018515 [Cervus elaphus hippelaphus]|uniref:Uncharacterized protein n=1 Tax=Cervus elaphus hippelaphus TaxID=46360 RepID=A0A212CM19_CEREH|nr:hypothetical protein Celaphus_00018515 [Cervus elaphus hippelaphus]
MWLNILPYNHAKLWPVINTCLSPRPHPTQDNNPRPCILGCFCEYRNNGCKFIQNSMGKEGFCSHMMPNGGND